MTRLLDTLDVSQLIARMKTGAGAVPHLCRRLRLDFPLVAVSTDPARCLPASGPAGARSLDLIKFTGTNSSAQRGARALPLPRVREAHSFFGGSTWQ